MPRINLLDKSVAELIAAGEVVERPASVIKELVENSIDAGADHITVEIQRGGITMMRITDNGCGISKEDVPLAFLRHATSKIKSAEDLDAIFTLGFRGEALAATSSVSRIEMLTKTADSETGTHYCIEGGNETLYEEAGCPDGTTIIVNDLFYNTPARMKFLKKDVSEGNAVAAVIDRMALSHPEISFKLIRDGKQTLQTAGDGKLESAVYTVLGRDFARSIINVVGENGGIAVQGTVCKPVSCRNSRAWQFVFLNGRFVNSGTVTAAVEQAYKNSAMVGKFPAFVLNITVPAQTVDVNVHPAKTQVRFSDEKRIFDAVYYTVKNALSKGDTRPIINPARTAGGFVNMSAAEYRQQVMTEEVKPIQKPQVAENKGTVETSKEKTPVYTPPQPKAAETARLNDENIPFFLREEVAPIIKQIRSAVNVDITREQDEPMTVKETAQRNVDVLESAEPETEPKTEEITTVPLVEDEPIRFIGEAFRTYIIVEKGNSIFLIDKHAAHERILFEKLKAAQTVETQDLLMPRRVTLGREEYDAAVEGMEMLASAGFDIEDFGNGTLLVRAVPAALADTDAAELVTEAAGSLAVRGSVQIERLDHLYHTIACKAATKAGYRSGDEELITLAKRVLNNKDIMYCPHGRPVAFELRRTDLEKQFGRIQ